MSVPLFYVGSLPRAMTTLPVRTISLRSNLLKSDSSASIFSVVPVASMVMVASEISTVLPRKTSVICKTSVRSSTEQPTLKRANSRVIASAAEWSLAWMTSTNLLSCRDDLVQLGGGTNASDSHARALGNMGRRDDQILNVVGPAGKTLGDPH